MILLLPFFLFLFLFWMIVMLGLFVVRAVLWSVWFLFRFLTIGERW